MNKKVFDLYQTLQKAGADVGTEQEFNDYFFAKGEQGYQNRLDVYNTFKQAGADIGASYEEFRDWLGLQPVQQQTPQQPQQQAVPKQPTQQALPQGGGYQPTPEEMAGFQRTINNATRSVNQGMQRFDSRVANMQRYRENMGRKTFNVGETNDIVEGEPYFNPETGQMEKTYITSEGYEFENRELADMEQRRENEEGRAQYMEENYPKEALRGRIDEQIAGLEARIKELTGPGGAPKNVFTNMYAGSVGAPVQRTAYDQELSDLTMALKDLKDARTRLDRGEQLQASSDFLGGIGIPFTKDWFNNWKNFGYGVWDALSDPSLYDMGISDLAKAGMYSRIKQKVENGEELSYSEMALALAGMAKAQSEQLVTLPHGYTAGVTTTDMAPFMAQMALSPLSGFGRGLARQAVRTFGRNGIKAVAARVGGRVVGNLAEAGVLSNTYQAGNTTADILNRYNGDSFAYDENGNLKMGYYDEDGNFVEGGKSGLRAIYEGQASRLIENFSELGFGGSINGMLSKAAATKIGQKMGLGYISDLVSKVGSTPFARKMKEFMDRTHWDGMIEEPLEEEYGIVLNAALQTGDSKLSDLWDSEKQADIFAGTMWFGGFMAAMNTAAYPMYRHQVKKQLDIADNNGQIAFGEEWDVMKDAIDMMDDKDVAQYLYSIKNNDAFTPEQRAALVGYTARLKQYQGASVADMLSRMEGNMSEGEAIVRSAYDTGAEAIDYPDLMKQYSDEAAAAGQEVESMGEEFAKMVMSADNPAEVIDYLLQNRDLYGDDAILAATDYYQKMSRYTGMAEAVNDRIDAQVQRANAEVAMNTHKETGNVYTAQSGDQDYYVIAGQFAYDDAGNPQLVGDGGAVVVKNIRTGEMEVKSPTDVKVMFATPAQDLINGNETVLRQQLEQEAQQDMQFGAPAQETYDMEDVVTLKDDQGNPVVGQIVQLPNAIDGAYVIQTSDNRVLQLTADDMNRRILEHNGQEVQRENTTPTEQPVEQMGTAPIPTEQELVAEQPIQPQDTTQGTQAGGEAGQQQTGGNEPAASALSRIPVKMDESGRPVTNRRGKPELEWHKASKEDAAAALIETTGGDMLMARDTATDLINRGKEKLEKIRKQKPRGEDPLEIAESRMDIKRQEEEQQAIIKQWQDVNQLIQQQMRDEEARKVAEREAAKSEEQRQKEAEEARIRKEQQDEEDRKKLREAIEKDQAKRNKEYEPLTQAKKDFAGDSDAMDILSDTEPRDLEEWVSSLIRPHSMLWQDASSSEIGLQKELGLKRADMQRMMNLLGTKENGAKPFNQVVLDIYEGLSAAMKEQYTDQDVRNTLLDLFNEVNSTRMMHLTEEHRIEEARNMAEENAKRDAEAQMEAWAEENNLTPEEKDTYKEVVVQTPRLSQTEENDIMRLFENNEDLINELFNFDDNGQNQGSTELDSEYPTGATTTASEGGEGQVQGQSTSGNIEENPAEQEQQGTEASADRQNVPDTNVSGGTQADKRANLKYFINTIDVDDDALIDRLTDAEVDEFWSMLENWEQINSEYGEVIEENKAKLKSKNEKTKAAAKKRVDAAQEKANKAFEPIEEFIKARMQEPELEPANDSYDSFDELAKDTDVTIKDKSMQDVCRKMVDKVILHGSSNYRKDGNVAYRFVYLADGISKKEQQLLEPWRSYSNIEYNDNNPAATWVDEKEHRVYFIKHQPGWIQGSTMVIAGYKYIDGDKVPFKSKSGKTFLFRADNLHCDNPNITKIEKGRDKVEIKTAEGENGWVGGYSIFTPMQGGGSDAFADSSTNFGTEEECKKYYAQRALSVMQHYDNAEKHTVVMNMLRTIAGDTPGTKAVKAKEKKIQIKKSEQLKPVDMRDAVRPESAELGVNEANAKARYQLSSTQKDAEGNAFFEKNGSIDLWALSALFAKAGRQQAPIRLTDRNLKHIIDEHGKEIGDAEQVFAFLDDVFNNATVLRMARGRAMFVVVENEKTDKAAIIKLMPSETGDYYNVESAGYYRKNKWKENEDVIADLSEPGQSDAVTDVSKPQTSNENGRKPINAETQASSSDGKDIQNSSNDQEKTQKSYGQDNKLVSQDEYEKLKERMRKKLLGQANVGLDPEVLVIGVQMAAYHIEAGARKFKEYAERMIADCGDVIRPYLKGFYKNVRMMPEVAEYVSEMDSDQFVDAFDVNNFDKAGKTPDAITKAQQVVTDRKAKKDMAEASEGLDFNETTINDLEDVTDKQTAADTQAVISEAESVIKEAGTATTEPERSAAIGNIDAQLDKIDEQLAFIGYYEADPDAPFHESYGRMQSAEKKAVKDIDKVAKRIAKDLGITLGKKVIANSNMAPIGGEVTFRIPLTANSDLYFCLMLEHAYGTDNLESDGGYFRIERKNDGRVYSYGNNHAFDKLTPYDELINDVKRAIKFDAPDFEVPEKPAAQPKKESKQQPKKTTAKAGQFVGSLFDDIFNEQPETLGATSTPEEIEEEAAKVDTNPTEAQKEAGNYQKGHIQIDGYDITIENPKGSIRKGVDANGNPWEVTMNNHYGYIRGTEGVDGDHIDVFLSDNLAKGKVFVIDQVKEDGTFDEHKVMYGFPDEQTAREAYLANYSKGWKGLGNITQVSREEFKKWVESSHRKTKPFAEYKSVKAENTYNVGDSFPIIDNDGNETYAKVNDIGDDGRLAVVVGQHGNIRRVVLTSEELDSWRNKVSQKDLRTGLEGFIANAMDDEDITFIQKMTDAEVNELNRLMDVWNYNEYTDKDEKSWNDMEEYIAKMREKYPLEGKEPAYKAYMTPEARKRYADEKPFWPHPELAFIAAAVEDGVMIPLEVLKQEPAIRAAEARRLVDESKGKLQLTDENKQYYAKKLMDEGSAVYGEDGKVAGYTGEVQRERKAFIVVGRPAAGKSVVFADPTSNKYKARIIDSDTVKPWLEGYDNGFGAGYVQDASAEVAEIAMQMAIERGENIVLPRVGGMSVIRQAIDLRKKGYTVELLYNEVTEDSSIMRAAARFARTGRYLSLDYLTSIGDKVTKIFGIFVDKKIGDYEHFKKDAQDLLRGPELVHSGKSFSREGLRVLRTLHGRREETAGNGVQSSLGTGGLRTEDQLDLEPIFTHAEWKSNEVPIGHKPITVWDSNESTFEEFLNENENDVLRREGLHEERREAGERTGQTSGRADGAGTGGSSEQNRPERSGSERVLTSTPAKPKQELHNNKRNNHGERGVDYAPTSPKARFNANVEAIKLMRQLMDDGVEAPTADEMAVLRQYSGWGGLGTFFNDESSAENKQLRELLDEDEYNNAVMSINSAYFTPANVIDSLWDIAKAMGFKGGNVLEGSAGIGNIIGQMPQDMSRRSNIEAVEIDKTSGNILKLLYPDAKVNIQGFQDTKIPNGSVDLAITNVPFVTGLHVFDKVDKDLSRRFTNIHDFCIAKNIRKLREGGIGLFITSSGTLDKSTDLRAWITDEGQADVVGAFRLNNETFGGTNVTSDIIVVRKRVNNVKSPNAIDVSSVTPMRVGSYEDKYGDEHQVSMDVNDYFKENPDMMAGEMAFGYEKGNTFRPGSYGLYPVAGKDQNKMLQDFVKKMAQAKEETKPVRQVREAEPNQLTAEKEGRMLIDDKGRLCVSQRGEAVPLGLNDQKVKGKTKAECFRDYQAVQKAVDDVLQQQLNNPDDAALKPKLDALNKAYDSFVKKYGYLHKNTAIAFLRNDIDFPSFQALENYKENKDIHGKVTVNVKKAPVFSGRVLGFKTEPKPKDVKDGVIASIFRNNTVDVDWIAEKLGRDTKKVRQEILDSRLAFEDPATGQLEIRYKYLSGNVREKLAFAEEYNQDGKYAANVEELRKAVPMDIPSHLIDFSLGSSWIPVELYKEYIRDNYGLNNIKLANVQGLWVFDEGYSYRNEKNRSAGVYSEKFHTTIFGHELVLAALNNRPVKVSKQVTSGYGDSKTTTTVYDQAATQACAVRVDEIKDEFKQWMKKRIQDDPELSARIEKIYNEKFNALVPMTIDEEFLPKHFDGANVSVDLYNYQRSGVLRGITAPTILAHEVGTGKSFTLISTAMEMRRLGTANKPMLVVQNATVAQLTADAKFLYPNAKVLSLSEKDRTAEGRRAFYAKIKYNDWDLIIVPQSTFDMIPDSPERELKFIKEKIDEKKHVLEAVESANIDSRTKSRMERELKMLEQQYGDKFLDNDPANSSAKEDKKKKKDAKREAAAIDKAETKAREQLDRHVDDVQYFDDLGVDAILVDEAHEYKHLGFQTAIERGIKGVDPSYSKKCAGLYNKTRSVYEKKGWKNVVFATGTPISNTAAEIWTFMKYLMPADVMKDNDIYYFDDFVHNFGNISQMLEFSTSGKFKENTRFAAYVNKPELIRIWSQVADTVLTEDNEKTKSKLPDEEGGKDQDVFLPQSPSLIEIMSAVRSELERFENMTGKEKKENSSIPLTMYGVAKRAAIDPRLVNPDAPDEPNSKTNAAVKEILADLKATKAYKGTVAVFCDNQNRLGKNAAGKNVVEWNIYDEMRDKLIAGGVPAGQIAIIKSGMTISAKQKVFDAVNSGDIRVVLGSTQTLGTGVNMQERLHLLIHMDAPDRPMDYTQRNGRILRQGNLHKDWGKTVRVVRFGVEDSLDVTAYQRLKTKKSFIDSIMKGKSSLVNNQVDRTVEEEEEGLFDNPVAVLSGSQYAMLKNKAERELRKYQGKKAQHEADQVYVTNALRRNNAEIASDKQNIADEENHLELIKKLFPDGKVKTITVEGVDIDMTKDDGAKKLGEALKEKINDPVNAAVKSIREDQMQNDKEMHFVIKLDGHDVNFTVNVEREGVYENGRVRTVVHKYTKYTSPDLRDSANLSATSVRDHLDNILDEVVTGQEYIDRIEAIKSSIDRLTAENEQLQKRVGMEFQYGKELEEARKHVDEYTELMKQEMAEKEAKYAAQQKEAKENGGFDLNKAEENSDEEELRYSSVEDDEPTFYSNALKAVEGIRQGKATPEQWLAMIVKAGGLKAGEDKWLGLSDWLNNTDKRTLTREEVIYFIRQNQIDVEEVHYSEQDAMEPILGSIYDRMGLEFRDDFNEAFDIEYGEFYIRNEKAAVELYNREHEDEKPLEYDGYALDEETEEIIMDWAQSVVKKANSQEKPINETRLQYTTDFLKNKREIALIVPTIEPWEKTDAIHFGDAGEGRAVAWIRFGETTTKEYDDPNYPRFKDELKEAEKARRAFEDKVWNGKPHQDGEMPGMDEKQWEEYDKLLKKSYVARMNVNHSYSQKKVLVIDEIQSKRHQEGREKGYKRRLPAERVEEMSTALNEARAFSRKMEEKYKADIYPGQWKTLATKEEVEHFDTLFNKYTAIMEELQYDKYIKAVPEAPFEKNWHELAMKRMLRYAAENGYDSIAWTTGAQQAERYNLGSVVNSIEAHNYNERGRKDYQGTNREVTIYTPNGETALYVTPSGDIYDYEGIGLGIQLEGKALKDVVGKELAVKLMSDEDVTLSTGDLQIGGEGMKGFYDEMLVRFMNKYGKKWGVQVQQTHLPNIGDAGLTMWSIDVTPDMRESVMQGQPMFRQQEVFEEGKTFPIYQRNAYGNVGTNVLDVNRKYWTDLMPDDYTSENQLLNAVREQYPEYYVSIDNGQVVFQTWEKVMAGAAIPEQTRKAKGTKSFIERKTRHAINAVNYLADKMHLDVEVLTTTEGLTGKKARAKGFFNPKTGKITIVLLNNRSQSDLINTLLHEGVAHFGLRKMFGENFDSFLDNVYNNVDPEIKARIDASMRRNKWDRHEATEEYLARLAERTDFDNAQRQGWWQKIKDFFMSMLAKAGFNTTLTDNELRYILWRSYDNLLHPNTRNIFDKAKDVMMQSKLRVGDYAERVPIRHTAQAEPATIAAEEDLLGSNDYSDEMLDIIDKAQADGTYMKAPNGKTTNLNELQWAQVRTKAFKNWFGDWENAPESASKVVDENGEPKVMHHGTILSHQGLTEPFYTFYPNSHFGTEGQANARIKGAWDVEDKQIYEVFLNIRNPQRRNDADQDYLDEKDMTMSEFWEQSVDRAKGAGHDGIVYLNQYEDPEHPADSWIAFNPNQIKSATENSGGFSTEDNDIRYSIRKKDAPKKTGKGYKVFVLKDGELYPPMVANPEGEGTPVGVWLDADAAPIAGTSKTGRPQVKAGGKGTQGGSGQLAYRPGWHLGTIPYALQFNRKDENGEKTLFPNNFVWAEVEYADDVDYQDEAHQEGINANGKYQHALAGLKHIPTDGSYKYRTNPDPKTDEWIITGAMRVNRILSREEVDEMVRKAGREPQKIQDGDILTQESVDNLNAEIKAMKEADEMGLLYSADEDLESDVARDAYEREVATKSLRWQEAWQDSMASLKAIQDAIAKQTGRKATGAEDAYHFENRMHGRAKNMAEQYDYQYYRPMLKAFADFCKSAHLTQEQGIDYLISKSGLERNMFYTWRNALRSKLADDIKDEREKLEKDYAKKRITDDEYRDKKAEIEKKEQTGVDDAMQEMREKLAWQRAKEDYEDGIISFDEYLRRRETLIRDEVGKGKFEEAQRDYSGITEAMAKTLYDDAQIIKRQAQRAIDHKIKRDLWSQYNKAMDEAYKAAREEALDAVYGAEDGRINKVNHLWNTINAATKETLKHSYESGMIDRASYNKVRDMFDYYLPLRGWDENKAADVYTYMGKDNVFSPTIKKVFGRTSKAENPLAYIGNIAVSTILSGHRNMMKQHFLNYVMNNPTSLVNISESWYENIGDDGEAPVWILRTADTAGKSPDEIATIVNDFNEEMEMLQREGKAMPVRGRLRLDVNATKGQKAEHVVEVQRAGRTYQLYINGNPKAAQALNGTNKEKGMPRLREFLRNVNRSMAAYFTSKNPAFVVANLARDLNMAGASVAIKESPSYNAQFIKNVAKVLSPRFAAGDFGKEGVKAVVGKGKGVTGMMPKLVSKWKNGKLNMSNETERYFKEFMDEGGETGFVNMLSIDSFKAKMQKEIKQANGVSLFGSNKKMNEAAIPWAFRLIGDTFEFYNRCAEDATRFIVYMTSRQMGKSLEESIADAKDVTLNFNRKGTGGAGADWMPLSQRDIQELFIFVNPAIQALANMYRMAKGHPLKFSGVTLGFVVLGMMIPWVNNLLLNMFGDDDDKDAYWNLPPWIRKNNLIMWIPGTKNFITIPLAQEFRVFYGVGEMLSSAIMEHPIHNMGTEIFESVADLVPINPSGNGGNLVVDFTPTAAQPIMQLAFNVDFTGRPLWKDNQGNEYDPMYQKAYISTPDILKKISRTVNSLTGGDEDSRGWLEKTKFGSYLNNPAVWNHILQGYLGGMYNTVAKTLDVAVTAGSGEMPKVYQVPVINRFLNRPVERDNAGVLGEDYWQLVNENKEFKHNLDKKKKRAAAGDEEAAKKVESILASDDYQRYLIIDSYAKSIDAMRKAEKETDDKEMKKALKRGISQYKADLMDELRGLDAGKDPLVVAMTKFDESEDPEVRKRLALRICKIAGASEDSYGDKPKQDYQRLYQDLRTAEDVYQDALLYALQEKLRDAGDEKAKEQLVKERKRVHDNATYLHEGKNKENSMKANRKIMEGIGRARKNLMKKYGLLREEKQ